MKNIERKGETAHNEQYLRFPQWFSFNPIDIDKLLLILTTSEIVVYICKFIVFETEPKTSYHLASNHRHASYEIPQTFKETLNYFDLRHIQFVVCYSF